MRTILRSNKCGGYYAIPIMNENHNTDYSNPIYMKQGNQLQVAPEIMTSTEAISFLRLDVIDGLKNPELSLQYLRQKGLRTVKIGRCLRYPKKELLRFIDVLLEESEKQCAW